MGANRPTEEEFNDWPYVQDGIDVAPKGDPHQKRLWLLDRLREGLILAVARTGPERTGGPQAHLVPVPPKMWKMWDGNGPDHFWATADATFIEYGRSYGDADYPWRFFGVRLDPSTFNGKPNAAPEADQELTLRADRPDLKSLSKEDAQRFTHALLHGWPDATEDWAHNKAQAFFAGNKVPRDWFRAIFRAIRGPRNRGRKPKPD